eukprot:SAG11_NODE_77_length_17985_cov_25.875657_2_plen_363_part_00
MAADGIDSSTQGAADSIDSSTGLAANGNDGSPELAADHYGGASAAAVGGGGAQVPPTHTCATPAQKGPGPRRSSAKARHSEQGAVAVEAAAHGGKPVEVAEEPKLDPEPDASHSMGCVGGGSGKSGGADGAETAPRVGEAATRSTEAKGDSAATAAALRSGAATAMAQLHGVAGVAHKGDSAATAAALRSGAATAVAQLHGAAGAAHRGDSAAIAAALRSGAATAAAQLSSAAGAARQGDGAATAAVLHVGENAAVAQHATMTATTSPVPKEDSKDRGNLAEASEEKQADAGGADSAGESAPAPTTVMPGGGRQTAGCTRGASAFGVTQAESPAVTPSSADGIEDKTNGPRGERKDAPRRVT